MTRAKPIRIIGRAGDSDSVGVASPLPLSLYVHLPWCLSKCPYCDFNSHEWRRRDAAIPEQRYLDALKADLEASLPLIWGRSIQSIFIGGGTPSLFSPAAIEQLLDMIRARVRLVADAEISLEANPGTFEAQRFAAYAKAGVNRLSIGVQSFSDDALRAIGRVHDADQARAAVEEAASVFRTFNVDLMYALPGQSLDALRADITEAIDRGAPHLSCYHLTLEPGTPFAKRPPVLPDEDVAAEMQASIDAACAEAGLARYEISAFAKAGHRCRHNLNYWEFGDYLGIGAGAHGKLSFSSRIVRQSRVRQPDRYMDALCAADSAAIVATPDPADAVMVSRPWIDELRSVQAQELPFEFMLNALRLVDGVPQGLFAERTGLGPGAILAAKSRAEARGLLSAANPGWIQPTELGLRFLNDLQEMFLS